MKSIWPERAATTGSNPARWQALMMTPVLREAAFEQDERDFTQILDGDALTRRPADCRRRPASSGVAADFMPFEILVHRQQRSGEVDLAEPQDFLEPGAAMLASLMSTPG